MTWRWHVNIGPQFGFQVLLWSSQVRVSTGIYPYLPVLESSKPRVISSKWALTHMLLMGEDIDEQAHLILSHQYHAHSLTTFMSWSHMLIMMSKLIIMFMGSHWHSDSLAPIIDNERMMRSIIDQQVGLYCSHPLSSSWTGSQCCAWRVGSHLHWASSMSWSHTLKHTLCSYQ